MKYTIGFLSFFAFAFSWATAIFAQDDGLIKQCSIPETIEHGKINYGVVLPPSYAKSDRSYPVIYYLHGLNGHYSDWQARHVAQFCTGLISNGRIPECILVFPDGKDGFWCDHYDGDPLLEKEIVEFLIPHLDHTYAVDKNQRLIMGWSAGGAGAITVFSKHPELFRASISLDGPIISWEDFLYFQGEKPEIVNNSDYYYENASPIKWVQSSNSIIAEKRDTVFFLAAALFAQSHQNFLSILKDQGIPFKYTELGCDHDFDCVFSEASEELITFLSMILDK